MAQQQQQQPQGPDSYHTHKSTAVQLRTAMRYVIQAERQTTGQHQPAALQHAHPFHSSETRKPSTTQSGRQATLAGKYVVAVEHNTTGDQVHPEGGVLCYVL